MVVISEKFKVKKSKPKFRKLRYFYAFSIQMTHNALPSTLIGNEINENNETPF